MKCDQYESCLPECTCTCDACVGGWCDYWLDKKFQNLCDAIAWADEAIANLLGAVHEGGYTILVGEAQALADGLTRLDRMTYPLDPCPRI